MAAVAAQLPRCAATSCLWPHSYTTVRFSKQMHPIKSCQQGCMLLTDVMPTAMLSMHRNLPATRQQENARQGCICQTGKMAHPSQQPAACSHTITAPARVTHLYTNHANLNNRGWQLYHRLRHNTQPRPATRRHTCQQHIPTLTLCISAKGCSMGM